MVRIGEMVHFVLPDGPETVHGSCRPALIITSYGEPNSPCDLMIFRNGWQDRRIIHEDGDDFIVDDLIDLRASVPHAVPKEFGRWHFIEECGVGV